MAREYWWDSRRQGRQKTDGEYAADLAGFLEGYAAQAVFVDPSAASFVVECRARGLPVAPAENAVLDGIRCVQGLMGAGRLTVHRSCANLIREIPGYVWDPKAAEKGDDKPLKVNDHACDALRYALATPMLARPTGRAVVPLRGVRPYHG